MVCNDAIKFEKSTLTSNQRIWRRNISYNTNMYTRAIHIVVKFLYKRFISLLFFQNIKLVQRYKVYIFVCIYLFGPPYHAKWHRIIYRQTAAVVARWTSAHMIFFFILFVSKIPLLYCIYVHSWCVCVCIICITLDVLLYV